MATARKEPAEAVNYVLTLSRREALAILAIGGNIGGSLRGPRGVLTALGGEESVAVQLGKLVFPGINDPDIKALRELGYEIVGSIHFHRKDPR